jgi:hypothetical protein
MELPVALDQNIRFLLVEVEKRFSLAVQAGPGNKNHVGRLRALEMVAVNLERISRFPREVLRG